MCFNIYDDSFCNMSYSPVPTLSFNQTDFKRNYAYHFAKYIVNIRLL